MSPAPPPRLNRVFNEIGAGVAGGDDYRILKIHRPSQAVRQPAVVKHLEEKIQDVRMRFLKFVQKNQTERLRDNGFRQSAGDLAVGENR